MHVSSSQVSNVIHACILLLIGHACIPLLTGKQRHSNRQRGRTSQRQAHVSSSSFDMNVSPSSQVSNVIVTANGGELPNAKLLRLLRLGRVVRLFKTLKSLNRLITAVSKAVVPVCNAFLILFIIAAIYAILGTNFFGEQSPEFFLNFKTSLFTMFQVLSGDGWSDLARSLFARDETDTSGIRKTDNSVAFFFVSYMLINSIMLLNVVVAVLLVKP